MADPVSAFIVKAGAFVIEALGAVIGIEAAVVVVDIGIKLSALALLAKASAALVDIPDLTTSARQMQQLIRGTVEHQRIVYGEVLIGGTLVYVNSAGTHNQSLYHVVAVAGHEIENITDMWLDDIEIPNAAIDWAGDGSVDSGDFRGNVAEQPVVYFDKFLGADNQTHSTDLASAFAEWTSAHDGRGIAYFHSRFDYFENQTDVWSAGPPNLIRALVKGKKVYDPRSDSTQSFGTGPHRLASSGTWEWSDNPALCWADYLIDNQLGMGITSTKIDYGYVASAAEICDGVVYTPVGTDKRFRCNGVLLTEDNHANNLSKILSSMNGSQCRQNGKWLVRAFGYESPTLTFDEDDLADDIQLSLEVEQDERFNTVRGTFIDKNRNWQAMEFPAFTSSEYVARDNGDVIYRDIQLPMTTDVYMAQRLAAGVLEQSDFQTKVVFPVKFTALRAEVNGTIAINLDKMQWTGKEFTVVDYAFNDMDKINMVLLENASGAYTDVGTAEYTVSSNGVYTTANPGVPTPSSAWVLTRIDGNLLQWINPPARLYEWMNVYAAIESDSFANAALISRTRGQEFLHQIQKPREIWYWWQAENYAGEYSNVLPSSGSSNISGIAGLLEGRNDYTFDLSEDIRDFYTILGNTCTIDTTGGLNGTHAALVRAIHFNGDVTIRTSPYFPIKSDVIKLRTTYKINSWGGADAGSQYLEFIATGYYPTPVDSTFDKFQKTEPPSWTTANDVRTYAGHSDLNTSGAWSTIERQFNISNIVGSGATHVRFAISWQTSSTVSVNANTHAHHNSFVFLQV